MFFVRLFKLISLHTLAAQHFLDILIKKVHDLLLPCTYFRWKTINKMLGSIELCVVYTVYIASWLRVTRSVLKTMGNKTFRAYI